MTLPSSGFLLVLAALAYLVSAVCYGAGVVRVEGSRRSLTAAGLISALVGALLHTAAIGARCITTRQTPFVTAPDTLSAVGWAIVLTFLALQICPLRDRTVALGALGLPLAFLFVFTGSAIRLAHPTASVKTHALDDNLVSLHVLAIVFAFGFLALAFGSALLYLLEDRLLKRKSVAQLLFWRLPPLTTIDSVAFTLVSLAFPLLTIGILAGIVRAVTENRATFDWSLEPHTLSSIVTWAIYGAYLWVRSIADWRGPKANALLLAGLAFGLLTYFVPSRLHQFG